VEEGQTIQWPNEKDKKLDNNPQNTKKLQIKQHKQVKNGGMLTATDVT